MKAPRHECHRLASAWRLALLLPLAACAAPPGPTATGSPRVDALIGAARCSTDADCRSSPIGEQACGGPAGFVAWSVQQTAADALQAALQQHQAEQRTQLQRDGRVSTCMVRVDPGAYCQVEPARPAGTPGRCTLRPAGSLPTR